MCPSEFRTMLNLKIHCRDVHQIELFQCKLCGYHNKAFGRYTNHYIRNHTDLDWQKMQYGSEKHDCMYCGRSFGKPYLLKQHVTKSHLKEAAYKCGTCQKSFVYNQTYRQHFVNNSKCESSCPRDFKGTVCDICGYMCANQSSLKHHIKRKHSMVKSECATCHKTYPSEAALIDHVVRCHNKTHICTYCGIGFGWLRGLKEHIRIHTGEKPYRCEFCDVSFAQSGSLCKHKQSKGHIEKCGKTIPGNIVMVENVTNSDYQTTQENY
ncbi:unnamed protein product [Owenia fusiformis]|uniref:Uncharacterized protein n=1 Tax=Owenia fusiformis TaxID=6347 RepID=A0A8J1U146_OWEFU|nr:unnamed protein product [Owenia fusiformis]